MNVRSIKRAQFGGKYYRVTWRTPDKKTLGQVDNHPRTFDREFCIDLDAKAHQAHPELLDTVVHECLHAVCPELNEDAVDERAGDIARFLWRMGWRLR